MVCPNSLAVMEFNRTLDGTKLYGEDWADTLCEFEEKFPYIILLVSVDNYADLSIHECQFVIAFKKYTRDTSNDLNGNVYGIPTNDEVQDLTAMCLKFGIPMGALGRKELHFKT